MSSERDGKLNDPTFADGVRRGTLQNMTCRWCKGQMRRTPLGALVCTSMPSCDGLEHMPHAQ